MTTSIPQNEMLTSNAATAPAVVPGSGITTTTTTTTNSGAGDSHQDYSNSAGNHGRLTTAILGLNNSKYKLVAPAKTPPADGEICIASKGNLGRYLLYAERLFTQEGRKSVTIKATGNAIAIAISLAEMLKRRFHNLHQVNTIGLTTISDTFQPLEEGLSKVVRERSVPFLEAVLTTEVETIDTSAPGYQEPIDQSLVTSNTKELIDIQYCLSNNCAYNNRRRSSAEGRPPRCGVRRSVHNENNGTNNNNNNGNPEEFVGQVGGAPPVGGGRGYGMNNARGGGGIYGNRNRGRRLQQPGGARDGNYRRPQQQQPGGQQQQQMPIRDERQVITLTTSAQ